MNVVDHESNIFINVQNESFQTAQLTTSFYCTSSQTAADSCVTGAVQMMFQSLSLDSQKEPPKPLDSNSQKFFKVFLKKNKASLEQSSDVQEFKGALLGVLSQLDLRMDDSDVSKQAIQQLQHDLKNQVLINVFKKYYPKPVLEEGTLLKELAPYLGDQEKIAALSLLEGEILQGKIIADLEAGAVNRDSLMALMISLKKGKYADFDCYTVDFCDLPECLEALKHRLDQTEGKQIQLLVRSDVHYTAVIVNSNQGVLQAAVMDAAKDQRAEGIAKHLKRLNCQKVFVVGFEDRIQFDSYNCGFFSFDSAFQAYKYKAFFELLNTLPVQCKGELHSIAWKDMPPIFVRNTTSTSFVRSYAAKNEIYKLDDTFETYLNKHIVQVDIGKGTPTNMHSVLATRVKKEGMKIQEIMSKLSHQELLAIVVNSSAYHLIKG